MSPEVLVVVSFLWYSIRTGLPLLLGTVGESIMEKSGSLNLGIEGIMAIGGIAGYLIGCVCDSLFMAIFGAFIASALIGLLYAFLTVTLKANQNVTGLAITIFGVGLCRYIGDVKFNILDTYPTMSEHFLSLIEKKPIPGLVDIPVIGELFFNNNIMVYLSVVLAIVCWIYMKYTRTGLRMRAIGENPGAADAVGIKIDRYKYTNIMLGSGIAGLGGLFISTFIFAGNWDSNWINGYGWISIALVIFANWSPAIAIFGSFLFGILLTLQTWAGNLITTFPDTLYWMSSLPIEFYEMLPFIITALVLIITSIVNKKQSGPAALGLSYFREER